MAKAPMYKGKTIDTNCLVVGKLLIENYNTYYIENYDIGVKKQVRIKSIATATKKEYTTFVNNYR